MAADEGTRVFSMYDAVITIGDGGGGAWNDSTGAALGSNQYVVSVEEGNGSLTFPVRGEPVNYLDRKRQTDPPTLRYGGDTNGSLTFTVAMRELTDASLDALHDIGLFCGGYTKGQVGGNWESTSASALAAGDANTNTVGVKIVLTDEGDASHVGTAAFNYCWVSVSMSEAEINTLEVNVVIYDKPDSFYLA